MKACWVKRGFPVAFAARRYDNMDEALHWKCELEKVNGGDWYVEKVD